MKQKWKVFAGIIGLIILIGGSTLLYGSLKESYQAPGQRDAEQTDAEQTDEAQETSAAEEEKTQAVDFTMVDSSGEEVKLSDFFGKPIVVNFWASWCPPCKDEMPEFEKVWEELGEDVTFLMINMTDGGRETKEKAEAYIEEQGFFFPVYYDTKQEAAYTYGVTSLPTTIFIDQDGYLITGAKGRIEEDMLRKGIAMIMPEELEGE